MTAHVDESDSEDDVSFVSDVLQLAVAKTHLTNQRDLARNIAVKLEAENAMLLHAIEQAIAALDSGAPDIARDFLVTATNYARGAL